MKKKRWKRTHPSSGGAEQAEVGKWASVAASCTKAEGREDLLWCQGKRTQDGNEDRKTEKLCSCSRCWDGPTIVLTCWKTCSKSIAALWEPAVRKTRAAKSLSCQTGQPGCKAPLRTTAPYNPTRWTTIFHVVCFSSLPAEPRCRAAFPSSRFSCNICPCKLKFIAFWLRYLHLITLISLIFLAAWFLVPNSYHQLQSQPLLSASPVPLPELDAVTYSQQLPAKLTFSCRLRRL